MSADVIDFFETPERRRIGSALARVNELYRRAALRWAPAELTSVEDLAAVRAEVARWAWDCADALEELRHISPDVARVICAPDLTRRVATVLEVLVREEARRTTP